MFIFSAYATQLLSFGTLIISLLIINNLNNNPGYAQAKTITQINWLCIGASTVAAMMNITAVTEGMGTILIITMIITVLTAGLSSACLLQLSKNGSSQTPSKKK